MKEFSDHRKTAVAQLSRPQLLVFCALTCEKMLPQYSLFSEAEAWGNANTLTNILNSVYQLAKGGKPSFGGFADELMLIAPDLDDFENALASYALDTCCAFEAVLQYVKTDSKEHVINNSQWAIDTVDMFVQLTEDINPRNPLLEDMIASNVHMQTEINRQKTILAELKAIEIIDDRAIAYLKKINDEFGYLEGLEGLYS